MGKSTDSGKLFSLQNTNAMFLFEHSDKKCAVRETAVEETMMVAISSK